jgi:hypothetical protein
LEDCSKEEQREKSFTTEDTEGTEKKRPGGKRFYAEREKRRRRGRREGKHLAEKREKGKGARLPSFVKQAEGGRYKCEWSAGLG